MAIEFKDSGVYKDIKDIHIRQENKLLQLVFGGNGDLYIDLYGTRQANTKSCSPIAYEIKKGAEEYPYFEQLIENILNTRVYSISEIELELCDTEEEKIEKLRNIRRSNERLKEDYRYHDLVQDGIIKWYSDSIYDEKANSLKIEKTEEGISLTFQDNPEDPCFGHSIRICNSGSKYTPFNLCFMKLFKDLSELGKVEEKEPPKEMIKNKDN